ncbi:hypothetical protein SLEP1_g56944 [Rubroshorea leprosula]|uniref:Uncharacterized protein n=1 Tax=Rubroshorea leprosula TaxID=152421 RepID=A0AAV5MP88_9ROSI|nr:hypothetical protein SLEP1_g56944 [Rubroshorea leprosula]
MSVKFPLMIRKNLVSSAAGGVMAIGDSTASGCGSALSFLPNSPPSPKRLVTDDAIPR